MFPGYQLRRGMMLFANPSLTSNYVNAPFTTMHVAPTILKALELSPTSLQSVELECTPVLAVAQF